MSHTNGYGAINTEWELPEAAQYSTAYAQEALGEDEWETPEASQFSHEALGEDEWETPEASQFSHEALGEDEWETPEAHGEDEWELPEASQFSHEALGEDEADPFLPFLAPLALKALPLLGKGVAMAAKSLLPAAKKMAANVAKNVLSSAVPQPQPRPQARPQGRPMRRPSAAATNPSQRDTINALLRQLSAVIAQGEAEAANMEAEWFGTNAFESELAANETAYEAALTEVLAAEAAHAQRDTEAAALVGAALPITIRITGGRRSLRHVMPALVQTNARLVRSLHRQGPAGRQLIRVVPTINRRTVASLQAMQRNGRAITPATVAQVAAAHTARVLGTPRIAGPALVRNTAVRQNTVAPARSPGRRQPGY